MVSMCLQCKMPTFLSNFFGDKIFQKLKVSADFWANCQKFHGNCVFYLRWQKSLGMRLSLKKLCLSHSVSQEPYIIYCDFWYTCGKWWYLQQIFSFFKILILGVFRGVKGQKIKLPISVCFSLYLRNCRSHQDFDNDIYRCFALFF